MTDSIVKKKSKHIWGEAETNTMVDILRGMDIMKFLDGRKHRNGDVFKRVKRMTWGGRESLIGLCSVTCKQEYEWNIL